MRNVETVVVAGNKLGKDWIGGFLCLWGFMCHKQARVVTTSATGEHLQVLWGEIGRFINTSKYPLLVKNGGPLVEMHQEIRWATEASAKNPMWYLTSRVASAEGEGLSGHHAPWSMGAIDEASGVSDVAYKAMQGWAGRLLIFGNPNAVPSSHYFRAAGEGGDIE